MGDHLNLGRSGLWELILIMSLMALLAAVATGVVAQTDPPASGDWVVDDITRVEGVTVQLEGNLTVTSNGHLTLTDVQLKLNSTWNRTLGITVKPGGTLVVKDVDHNPYTIYDATVISSTSPFWHYTWICEQGSHIKVSASIVTDCGVRAPFKRGLVLGTDDALIENSTFWGCNYGLYVLRSSPIVEDSFFYLNEGYGIYVYHATPKVVDCTLYENYDTGIFIAGSNGTIVRDCTIRDHEWAGLYGNNSAVNISGSTFTNNTWYGIRLFVNSTGVVSGCTVSDTEHVGIYLGENCSLDILDNEVHNITNRGIWVYRASPLVSGNHVHDCQNDSVFFYGSDLVLRGNLLERNGKTGIIASDSNGFIIEDCEIRDNGNNGIFVGSLWTGYSTGTVKDCIIRGNDRAGMFVADNSICLFSNGILSNNGQYGIYCDGTGRIVWTVKGASSAIDEILRVRGSIDILGGGELLLRNTTLVMISTPGDMMELIIDGGTMNVIDGDDDRFTPFDASEVISAFISSGYGYVALIEMKGDGELFARNSHFTGINILMQDGRLDAKGCEFRESGQAVMALESRTNITLVDCALADLIWGVDSLGGGPIKVTGCSFSRIEKTALKISEGGSTVVFNNTFISCGLGVFIHDSDRYSTQLDELRIFDCDIGVQVWGSHTLYMDGIIIQRSTSHGILLERSRAFLDGTIVTECGEGGIVLVNSTVQLTSCSIARNNQTNILATNTDLWIQGTTLSDARGIGVSVDGGKLRFDDCFLGPAVDHRLRISGDVHAVAYNTTIPSDAVLVEDSSSLEVFWRLRVSVVMEGGGDPPIPLGLGVADKLGTLVMDLVLNDPPSTNWSWQREYKATSEDVQTLSPYQVTAGVAGRHHNGTVELEGEVDFVLTIPLELVPIIDLITGIKEGDYLQYDARASRSYPFPIVSWAWDFDPGGIFEVDRIGETVNWTFTTDGDHTVELRITDSRGNSNSTKVIVSVLDQAPHPFLGFEPPEQLREDENLTMVGGYTSPVDDVILQEWDFGDGVKATGHEVTFAWPSSGTHTVTFTVYDNDGSTASITFEVMVVNVSPVAAMTRDYYETGKRVALYFDGSPTLETPSDRSSLNFSWDFGDGRIGHGAQVYHPFARAGTYTVTLTVEDDDGAPDSTRANVVVTNEPPTFLTIKDMRLEGTDATAIIYLLEIVTDGDDDHEDLEIVAHSTKPGIVGVDTYFDVDDGWSVVINIHEDRAGTAKVTLTALDLDSGNGSTSFNVTVDDGFLGGTDDELVLWTAVAILAVAAVVVVAILLARKRAKTGPEE